MQNDQCAKWLPEWQVNMNLIMMAQISLHIEVVAIQTVGNTRGDNYKLPISFNQVRQLGINQN